MAKAKAKPYPKYLMNLMEEKSAVLLKAHTYTDMGLPEIAAPLWGVAAAQEELVAPHLEAIGHDLEAAVHRISAASCYRKAGDSARAANLFRAALSGPLLEHTRRDVEQMLAECLAELNRSAARNGKGRKAKGAATRA